MATVSQLRKQAKDRYQDGKGQQNLKGYSRLGKAALLSKLGLSDEAKAQRSQTTRRNAVAVHSSAIGGDSAVKKAQVKGRILRSVKRGLVAEEKKQGRSLTQEEKRVVAARSLASEVKLIKSGKPESKPKRGNGQAKKSQVAKNAIASFKRKPKPEVVEQKIKLEDVKTPSDRAKYAKQEAAHQRSLGNEKAAKAWDEKAKEGRKAAISRDMGSQKATQTGLFGVTDHASDMPLFGGSDSKPKKPASGLAEVSPYDLNFDPKRFQYKMVHGAETGSSGSLTGVGKWDENLGGVMQVWRDPVDGKDYVVNGHNRAALARKLGAEKVAIRYLAVDTAHEARAIGALTNIAEGRGNALDAAKFFRDSGITREDLEKKGIPMKEAIATNGLALSKLAPHLFDKVVQGDIPTERATLIGDRISDHDAQNKLVELLDREQKKGRKITNDVVRELADTVQSAPSRTETQFDLFGASETTQNLALEKAELTAHVRGRLSREKKLFGLVSKSKAASELERGGNTIDTEKSKDISDQASQVLGVFDQLKNQSGPVSAAINRATERIAGGEDPKQVKDELHRQLLSEIPQALGIRKTASPSGTESPSRSGKGQKALRVKRNA